MTNSSKFRLPVNAITTLEELTAGTTIYKVYGIYQPSVNTIGCVITRAPIQYKNHPDFNPDSSLGDSFVVDLAYQSYTTMEFCSDSNIGEHYNNNYWFKTLEDAEIYAAQCLEDWNNAPEEIARILYERELDHMMDCEFDHTIDMEYGGNAFQHDFEE